MVPPNPHAHSSRFWLTDLRKIALVACIASVLSLPISLWNAIRSLMATESAHPGVKWWIIPVSALMLFVTAIMPAFYFALYRDERTFRIPKRLRPLALAGALGY